MQKYKGFRPTGYDSAGLNADTHDIGEMYVLPTGRNRDLNALNGSNFRATLKLLGGEDCEHVQVHRFNHWACGWFELILVDDSKLAEAQAIEKRLEEYLVLDYDDFSNLEYEQANDFWDRCGLATRIEMLSRAGLSIFASRRLLFDIEDDNGRLLKLLRSN